MFPKSSIGDSPSFHDLYERRVNLGVQIEDVVTIRRQVYVEFYGIPRNNPEIADFLKIQCWYPAAPRPIDPALKKRLEN